MAPDAHGSSYPLFVWAYWANCPSERGIKKCVNASDLFTPCCTGFQSVTDSEIFIRERPLQRIQQARGCADISQHLLSFSLFCTEISHRVEWVYKPFLDFLWCFWCNNLLGTWGRDEQRSQREGYLFPFQSEGAFSRTSKRIEAKVLQLLMRVLKNKSVIWPNLTFIMEFRSYPKVKGRFCAHIWQTFFPSCISSASHHHKQNKEQHWSWTNRVVLFASYIQTLQQKQNALTFSYACALNMSVTAFGFYWQKVCLK